jgi:hypothetical protein
MEKPDKRRKYDAALKAEGLRMDSENRSTQAARLSATQRHTVSTERTTRNAP